MQDPFNRQNDPNNDDQDPLSNLPLPPNYAKVVNPENGQIRAAKVGVSWTTLWFGPIPALMRGDWYNFALMIVLDMIYFMGVSMLGLQITMPIPAIIFGLIYNLMYFRHLFTLGYQPADDRSKELLTMWKYWKE
ncbi:hypothetical protein FC26_GL001963 [Paucilactobacillus vaccinostercus DSM 20634]|jgi:hypothetical protein|uniref:DUF2628 domain-containing protein n=1 Tax=Paucilactobacillus vaccinostercus DSM 20634 TaxID=1423813 RepID=A0A0R2ABV9_9LACO|nr:hypothetical protein [Paucilactobacillus vaccinostercus]KRM61193.1 hypothetical protein FC26_GL001963 [Paucilactobacillus vaccinostercus DSM 20634]RRG08486.1 MAG: hypothetical protein DUD32_11025 [Lactobacillus sp.]